MDVQTPSLRERDPDIEALRQQILSGGDVPRHVAVIMDGNGRWAKRRGLARIKGHHAGRKPVRECVEASAAVGVEALTLYTFSVENWSRPPLEVKALMRFLSDTLVSEREELKKQNVRLETIGRIHDLPEQVRDTLRESKAFLAESTGLRLTLALSYSGRAEIVDAARAWAAKVKADGLDPDTLDEAGFESLLYDDELPHPDLLVRTSGEMRISNFLLWQMAYAEIHVTDVLWPDFDRRQFYTAILDYQGRERRFGRVD